MSQEIKPPTTYKEQLKILIERGLIIPSQNKAIEVLEKVNYYRLSAYFLSLKEGGNFKEGSTFDDVYNLYEFDRKLRNLLMEHLEGIEVAFRTHIAYYLAHKYGPLGYMESANFVIEKFHTEFIQSLHKELQRRTKSELFVAHYNDVYGAKYPIWLAIEVTTFTQLSKLFRNLKNEDKRDIAKVHYDAPYTYIQNWLLVLSQVRNTCAHYARIYNKNFATKISLGPKDPKEISNDKIFATIFTLKKLTLSREEWTRFRINLEALIDEYIEIIELDRIGFPPGWKELLR